MSTVYDADFYLDQQSGSQRSAEEVIPLLLSALQPGSVVDLGCGIGTWLSVVKKLGIDTVLGLDGEYVDRKMLRIPEHQFIPADFRQEIPTDSRFDLALCLEVAEHLPPETGARLVSHLAALAPVVAFSAAIPGQGGTDHINEQWQDYWRAEFGKHGFEPVDLIRPQIWQNDAVDFWYRQNLIVYASPQSLIHHGLTPVPSEMSLDLVHPKQLAAARDEGRMYLSKALGMLPGLVSDKLRRKMA